MTADEVLEKLLEMGIKRDKRTLRRYAKEGLITPPQTQSLGRGVGRVSDYEELVPYEIHSLHHLMQGLGVKSDKIKIIRLLAISVGNAANKTINEFIAKGQDYMDNAIIEGLYGKVIKEQGEPCTEEILQEFGSILFMSLLDAFYEEHTETREAIPNPKEAKLLAFYWYAAAAEDSGIKFVEDVKEFLEKKNYKKGFI